MFCSKCGAQLPDGSAFCSFCGANLSGGTTPAQSAEVERLYKAAREARDRGDGANALRYYTTLAEKDPLGWEPLFFCAIYRTENMKNGEIISVAADITACIGGVLGNIKEQLTDLTEQKAAVKQVADTCYATAGVLTSASQNFYNMTTKGTGLISVLGGIGGIIGGLSHMGGQIGEDRDRRYHIAMIMQACAVGIETHFGMEDADYAEYSVWCWKKCLEFNESFVRNHGSCLFTNEAIQAQTEKIRVLEPDYAPAFDLKGVVAKDNGGVPPTPAKKGEAVPHPRKKGYRILPQRFAVGAVFLLCFALMQLVSMITYTVEFSRYFRFGDYMFVVFSVFVIAAAVVMAIFLFKKSRGLPLVIVSGVFLMYTLQGLFSFSLSSLLALVQVCALVSVLLISIGDMGVPKMDAKRKMFSIEGWICGILSMVLTFPFFVVNTVRMGFYSFFMTDFLAGMLLGVSLLLVNLWLRRPYMVKDEETEEAPKAEAGVSES